MTATLSEQDLADWLVRDGVGRNGAATNGREPYSGDARLAARSVVVCLGDVMPERVTWLAPGFLPLGKFVIVEGDPGQGKSTLTLEICARVTRGQSVLGAPPREPRNVVLVTYEDGLADTVRPRIDALGGDANRVYVFRAVAIGDADERPPTFPDDVSRLQAIIRKYDAALVILDPLGAALSDAIDSHKDAAVRRVTARLAQLAEDTSACILGVRHLTKAAASNAVRAGGGSIAFIGAARVALLVSEHPDDRGKPQHERRRVLATVKNNLAPHAPSRIFELYQPEGHEHPRIRLLGETTLSADDLNAVHADAAPEERDQASERGDWLREILRDGPLDSKELRKLAREAGYNERTLRRTAQSIGVQFRREGNGRNHRTVWELTALGTQNATAAIPTCRDNVSGAAGVQLLDGERRQ
jgi:hypothetical protein